MLAQTVRLVREGCATRVRRLACPAAWGLPGSGRADRDRGGLPHPVVHEHQSAQAAFKMQAQDRGPGSGRPSGNGRMSWMLR